MAYDLTWAEGVYDNFYQVHVLSCREINRLYKISVDSVIRAIANGNDQWRGYKSLVKHTEKMMKTYWKHFHSAEGVREKYLTFDKYLRVQLKKRIFPGTVDLLDTEIQQVLF